MHEGANAGEEGVRVQGVTLLTIFVSTTPCLRRLQLEMYADFGSRGSRNIYVEEPWTIP